MIHITETHNEQNGIRLYYVTNSKHTKSTVISSRTFNRLLKITNGYFRDGLNILVTLRDKKGVLTVDDDFDSKILDEIESLKKQI